MRVVAVLILFSISAFCLDYYTLQFGAFSTKKNAKRFVEVLKDKGGDLKPFIKLNLGLYKVYAGKYDTYEEAKHKENYLHSKLNLSSFVSKIEIDEKRNSKISRRTNFKDKLGIQILAVRNKNGIDSMMDKNFEYKVLSKDGLYKLLIKCNDRADCENRLPIIRRTINKSAFITKYSDDKIYTTQANKSITNRTKKRNAQHSDKTAIDSGNIYGGLSHSGDTESVEIERDEVETIENSIEKESVEYHTDDNANETITNISTKESRDGLFSNLSLEFQPVFVDSRYFLYENKISNSKIYLNGKKYSSLSSINSFGFGVDIYDNYFLVGKIGTRSSDKYLLNDSNKDLIVKVSYPIVASANAGYRFNISNQELYKIYLYSALGASIAKKDVEVIDFNDAKYKDSSTCFGYSLSSGFMMNFYDNLLFKIGASRDFESNENGIEFSLNYEF